MTSYLFFDVETPNRRNDRPCSIGLQRTDSQGRLEYSDSFLIDPEEGFDQQSIAVHGIRPSQVRGRPTFEELWESELSQVASGCVMVAHNAGFDMSVLGKALDSYGIAKPDMVYIDTLDAARRLLTLPDYGLDTVSAHYGVDLARHHDAMDDTAACRGIYWSMYREFGPVVSRARPWVWVPYDSRAKKASGCDAAMSDLYGIALGLVADQRILLTEERGLRDWMERNHQNRNTAFICDAYELLEQVLADGVVTEEEIVRILNLTRPFTCNGHNCAETIAMQELIGFLRGISCDEHLNSEELETLERWLDELPASGNAHFARVRQTVEDALADGVVTTEEEKQLLACFEAIINPTIPATGGGDAPAAGESAEGNVTGIDFEGRRFVLSGTFTHGSKAEVENYITSLGGEVAKSVSGKVAYVVIGGEGSSDYAYGSYGTKVKKAMELQAKGKPIQIITEGQLYE